MEIKNVVGGVALSDVIRTPDEELRYNFIEKYRQWRFEAEKPYSSSKAVDGAWEMYVDAREHWIYGPRKKSFVKAQDTTLRWAAYRNEDAGA